MLNEEKKKTNVLLTFRQNRTRRRLQWKSEIIRAFLQKNIDTDFPLFVRKRIIFSPRAGEQNFSENPLEISIKKGYTF